MGCEAADHGESRSAGPLRSTPRTGRSSSGCAATGAGACLLRDIDDRVAEVQIDPVYGRVFEILDTSPAAPAALRDAA